MQLPNYLRKLRAKQLAEQDTFFDNVTNTMKQEGQNDISDFLSQLKQRKEEAKRLKEEAERDDDSLEKKSPSKTVTDKQ